MARYRVVVVGSGFGSQVHVPIIRSHSDFELAGFISRIANSPSRQLAEKFHVPHYRGIDELVSSPHGPVDLVVVANPPFQHLEVVTRALKCGMHVFAEKPLAASALEAARMVMTADEVGRRGWVNFEFRMLESRRELKERLSPEKSVVGRVLSFYWIQGGSGYHAYIGRPAGWNTERDLGGGYLGALGSHMLDYLVWLFGEVATVQAMEVSEVKERANGVNHSDDGFTVMLSFVSGVTGVVHYRSASRKGLGSVLEVTGTDGGYRLVNDKNLYVFDRTGVLIDTGFVGEREQSAGDAGYRCTQKIYEAISRELDGAHDSTLPEFRDGLAVQKIMDAIHQSHDTGMRCGIS